MGYRSALYVKVHGSDLIHFMGTLKEHGLDEYFVETSELDEEGYTKYISEGLKWYDSYPDVSAINSIINESTHSVMVRIGEEPGDIEYYGDSDLAQGTFEVNTYTEVEF